jgi:hypothetical protein
LQVADYGYGIGAGLEDFFGGLYRDAADGYQRLAR